MNWKLVFVLPLLIIGCISQETEASLAPDQFEKGLKESDVVLIDVRTPEEFESGHITGAKNINWNDDAFESQMSSLSKDDTYYIYCLKGGRSGSVMSWMKENGFQSVYDLKGGISAWNDEGKPLE